MIYTDDIIDFNRSDAQLEELMLFLIFVANKPAQRTALVLDSFLKDNLHRPFDHIRDLIKLGTLTDKLAEYRVGQYGRITKALTQLVHEFTGSTLRTVTPDTLEKIHTIIKLFVIAVI